MKYRLILRKDDFQAIDIAIHRIHGFDPENNYHDDELVYDQVRGFLLEQSYYVVKKI